MQTAWLDKTRWSLVGMVVYQHNLSDAQLQVVSPATHYTAPTQPSPQPGKKTVIVPSARWVAEEMPGSPWLITLDRSGLLLNRRYPALLSLAIYWSSQHINYRRSVPERASPKATSILASTGLNAQL